MLAFTTGALLGFASLPDTHLQCAPPVPGRFVVPSPSLSCPAQGCLPRLECLDVHAVFLLHGQPVREWCRLGVRDAGRRHNDLLLARRRRRWLHQRPGHIAERQLVRHSHPCVLGDSNPQLPVPRRDGQHVGNLGRVTLSEPPCAPVPPAQTRAPRAPRTRAATTTPAPRIRGGPATTRRSPVSAQPSAPRTS